MVKKKKIQLLKSSSKRTACLGIESFVCPQASVHNRPLKPHLPVSSTSTPTLCCILPGSLVPYLVVIWPLNALTQGQTGVISSTTECPCHSVLLWNQPSSITTTQKLKILNYLTFISCLALRGDENSPSTPRKTIAEIQFVKQRLEK